MNDNDPDKYKHPCKQYGNGQHYGPCGSKSGGVISRLDTRRLNLNADGTNLSAIICGMCINNLYAGSVARVNSSTSDAAAGSSRYSKKKTEM